MGGGKKHAGSELVMTMHNFYAAHNGVAAVYDERGESIAVDTADETRLGCHRYAAGGSASD